MRLATSGLKAAVVTAMMILGSPDLLADEHNLLANPDLEQPITTGGSGWELFQTSMVSEKYARSGEHSIYHGGFSRKTAYPPSVIGIDSGAYQEFPAKPGSKWRMTGYGLTPSKLIGSPAFGLIQISFFDSKGQDLGTVETEGGPTKAKLSAEINGGSAVDKWIFLDTGIATAPAGTAVIRAFTLFVDHSGSAERQGVYFDDLELSVQN